MDWPAIQTARYRSHPVESEVVVRQPTSLLRGLVGRYCGYDERITASRRRLEVPSGDVTLIIGLGSEVGIAYPGLQPDVMVTYSSFVAGLHDTYAVAVAAGWQQGVEVTLTPVGARVLFGVPMHTLTNCVVELEAMVGRGASLLAERLFAADTWDMRFALLDRVLLARLDDGHPPSPEVSWAWNRLCETSGRVAIGTLAAYLGCSPSRLVAQFHEQVGLPPKTLARIQRFSHAVRRLERRDGRPLAEIAEQCGYYDQAHLNRDFRQFTGSTPTQVAARFLPDGGLAAAEHLPR